MQQQRSAFLKQPSIEGETYECPSCLANGTPTPLKAKSISDGKGGMKLSWRNGDGKAHQQPPDFAHVPYNGAGGGGGGDNESFLPATESELVMYKDLIEESSALNIISVSVLNERGEKPRGDKIAYEKRTLTMLMLKAKVLDLQKAVELKSAEIGESTMSIHKTLLAEEGVSFQMDLLTAQDLTQQPSLENNIKKIISSNPTFFSEKTTINEKITLYLSQIYGIELPDLPISLESISRAFRYELNDEHKHYDKQEEYKKKYGK